MYKYIQRVAVPYLRFTNCGLCRSCATNESTCFAKSISPCNCASWSNSDPTTMWSWVQHDFSTFLNFLPCTYAELISNMWFMNQFRIWKNHHVSSCFHLLVHAPLLDHLLWIANFFITLEFPMETSFATSDPFFEATGKVKTVAWYQGPIYKLIWPPNVLLWIPGVHYGVYICIYV